jgi:cysteine-rich repeat protein
MTTPSDPSALRRLPYPLATAWARATSLALTPAERLAASVGALDVVLRFVGAVAVQDYLRGPPSPPVERLLARPMRKASGTWLELVRECLKATAERSGPAPFVPELCVLFTPDGPLDLRLGELVEERNRSHGHAGQPSVAEQARAAEVLAEGLEELFDALAPLAWYRVCRVLTEARTRRGTSRGKVRFYAGQLLETPPRRAEWDGPLVQEALYLCAPDGLSVLELSPLMQVRTDPGTRREALYLWSGTEGDRHRLWLRNDDTGHAELVAVHVEGRDTSFKGWLQERAARTTRLGLRASTQGLGTRLPPDIASSTVASLTERFLPIEPLGEGGMAVVWRVRDALTGEVSALKVLKASLADDDVARDRFLREARTLSGLTHPRIVPVLEVLEWPAGGLGLRMPVYERGSVREVVEDTPPTPAQVQAWLVDALDALSFLHARGIVHRDVKPPNLLVGDDGRLQLTDFGIALGPDDARLTQTREALGTTGYMAPEQLRGASVGPAADIYALGISAHEWLTGELPSGAAGRHLEAPLGPLLAAMTAQEPEERPDAKTLLLRLGTRPTFATDPGPRSSRVAAVAPRAPRRRLTVAVWIALGLAASALAMPSGRARLGRLIAAGSCGNGIVDEGEACDDGNGVDSDACANDCRPNAAFLHGMGPQQTYWWMGARTPCTNHRDCDREQPATPVLSDPFWLAKTETTLEAFVAWAPKAGVSIDPGLRERARREPLFPVADVTYDEARRLCEAMGGRLPSEAEWEYAARDGGQEVAYPWGDARLDCERAIHGDHRCSNGEPRAVCSRPSGNSSAGLCDLAGNVWEWVVPAFDTPPDLSEDGLRPYPGLPDDGRPFRSAGYFPDLSGNHPIRGGGFWHTVAHWHRARARYAVEPWHKQNNIGFRCAWDRTTFPAPGVERR